MRTKLSILFWIIQNRPQIFVSNGIMNYPPHKPSMKDALIIANSSYLPLINIKK